MGKYDRNPFGYSDRERVRRAGCVFTDEALSIDEWYARIDARRESAVGVMGDIGRTPDDEPNSWRDLMAEVRAILAPVESPGVDVRDTIRMLMESHRLGRMAMEWLKGCSHAPNDPRECEDCTAAFLEAVYAEGEGAPKLIAGSKLEAGDMVGVDASGRVVPMRMTPLHEPITVDTPRMERRIGEMSSRWEMRTPTVGEVGYVGEAVQGAIDRMNETIEDALSKPLKRSRGAYWDIACACIGSRFSVGEYGEGTVVGVQATAGKEWDYTADVVRFQVGCGPIRSIPILAFVMEAGVLTGDD